MNSNMDIFELFTERLLIGGGLDRINEILVFAIHNLREKIKNNENFNYLLLAIIKVNLWLKI